MLASIYLTIFNFFSYFSWNYCVWLCFLSQSPLIRTSYTSVMLLWPVKVTSRKKHIRSSCQPWILSLEIYQWPTCTCEHCRYDVLLCLLWCITKYILLSLVNKQSSIIMDYRNTLPQRGRVWYNAHQKCGNLASRVLEWSEVDHRHKWCQISPWVVCIVSLPVPEG